LIVLFSMMLELSVVIPAYNEQFRLPPTLKSVKRFLSEFAPEFEIIVVDDGSRDATAQIVKQLADNDKRIKLVSYEVNKGKGYAVRLGVLTATGNFILLNDADGSSPIEEIVRLRDALSKGADIAIGSRAKPDPTRAVKALAYRTYMGNTFNGIVQSLLLPGIYDTQCGFKLFKHSVAKEVFSRCCIDDFATDVEILYIARRLGYLIEEIAINWVNVDGYKINLMVDPVRMLASVIKMRLSPRYDIAHRTKSNEQLKP